MSNRRIRVDGERDQGEHSTRPMEDPDVYRCTDYRVFLREAVRVRKERDARFSLRALAGRIGIDHSLLAKVLGGQRHLSSEFVPAISKALGLDRNQSSYLETLASANRARSAPERERLMGRLASLRPHERSRIDASRYDYFRSWRHVAIRSLLDWHDFDGEDWDGLGRMLEPPVPGNQARESVDILLGLGLLARDPEGRLRPSEAHVSTGDRWHSQAVREFQKEVLRLSETALDRIPPDRRDDSTLTVAFPVVALEEIRTALKEARAKVVRIADQYAARDSDAVFQLNLQLFPVTRWPRGAKP